ALITSRVPPRLSARSRMIASPTRAPARVSSRVALNPAPSSSMLRTTVLGFATSRTDTCRAAAWRLTLASADWQMRPSRPSAAGGSRRPGTIGGPAGRAAHGRGDIARARWPRRSRLPGPAAWARWTHLYQDPRGRVEPRAGLLAGPI